MQNWSVLYYFNDERQNDLNVKLFDFDIGKAMSKCYKCDIGKDQDISLRSSQGQD